MNNDIQLDEALKKVIQGHDRELSESEKKLIDDSFNKTLSQIDKTDSFLKKLKQEIEK
jgi:hypothetical protein